MTSTLKYIGTAYSVDEPQHISDLLDIYIGLSEYIVLHQGEHLILKILHQCIIVRKGILIVQHLVIIIHKEKNTNDSSSVHCHT